MAHTKNKTQKHRLNVEVNNETTTFMDFEVIPTASNYVKMEPIDYSEHPQQIEETFIKEEAELVSAEYSLEEDESYWNSSSKVSDIPPVENNWEEINHNRRIYKRKVYPIENKCGICHKKFSFQRDLVKHAQQTHPNAKAFKCQYCTTLFSKIKSITTHLKRCHPNLTKTLPCEFCHKSFFIRFQLERHRRTHIEQIEALQSENKGNVEMNEDIFKNRKGKVYPIANHCAVCAKKFPFQKNLVKHTEQAHPNAKVFKCLYCSTIFSKLKSVTTHYKRSHSKAPKTIFCDYCNMSFFTKFLLERHRRAHTECRPFACSLCEREYKYKRNLLVHMKTHTEGKKSSNTKIVKDEYCENDEECTENDDDQYLLTDNEHYKNVEQKVLTGDEDYGDNDDDQYFLANEYCENNEEDLLTEDEYCKDDEQNLLTGKEYCTNEYEKDTVVVKNNIYPFRCNECGKAYKFKNDLKAHQKSHQQNNELTEIINVTEGTATDQDNSNIYRNTYFIIDEFNTDSEPNEDLESGEVAEPYYSNEYDYNDVEPVNTQSSADKQNECAVCSKSFTCQQSIAKHFQRCHPDIEFFKCPYCDDYFFSLDSLSQHIHVRKHPQKPYVCEMCFKSFNRKSDWKRHRKIHNDERPYVCNVCHKSFKIINQLKRHEETHSSRKHLICEYCLKSFSNSESLNGHLKTHTGEFKFLCTICNKVFKMKSFLVNHLKTHRKC